MTRDEAAKWMEALYGIKPKILEPKPMPTNIIYVPADVWRRYPSKKSA